MFGALKRGKVFFLFWVDLADRYSSWPRSPILVQLFWRSDANRALQSYSENGCRHWSAFSISNYGLYAIVEVVKLCGLGDSWGRLVQALLQSSCNYSAKESPALLFAE